MRVLFVAHAFPREQDDVAGAFILRLAVALRECGVTVDVLAPSAPGLPRRAELDGIRVDRFRYAPAKWETLSYTGTMAEQVGRSWRAKAALAGMVVGARRAVQRAAAGQRYDVIHAHWWFPSGLAAVLASRARPLILTVHGSDVRLGASGAVAPRLLRFVVRRAAAVTAVSAWLAASVRRIVPNTPIDVLPMPVDLGTFRPGDGERAGVLFVGRLNAQKGIRDLVMALRDAPTIRLDVVGDGPERTAMERLAAESGLAARIRWHGTLLPDDLAPMYRRAAAVVMPSRDEGLGLVAVEALLSGTPVIAYRSGGMAELVESGVTGELVAWGDVAGLAAAMTRVVTAPQGLRRLGESARARLIDRFAPSVVAARYANLYRGVSS